MQTTIEYLEPEAFQPEWAEEQAVKAELARDARKDGKAPSEVMALFKQVFQAEQRLAAAQTIREMCFLKAVRKELEEAKGSDRKYARLARKYVARLRKLFWQGHLRKQVQELLCELELEATVPMSDLDTTWLQDGETYVEIDSYTKKPMTGTPVTNPWERDHLEVQEYMRLCEQVEDYAYTLEADPSVMELLINMAMTGYYREPAMTNVPVLFYGPSDDARFTQELAGLGYAPEEIEAADKIQFDLAGGDDPVVYLDEQDEAQQNGAVEQMATDGADPAEVAEIKRLMKGGAVGRKKDAGLTFEDECREKGIFKVYGIACKISHTYLRKFDANPSEKVVLRNIWNNRFGRQLDVMLYGLGCGFKPASLAVAFLCKEEWEPLAELVPIPGYDHLGTFIEMFGDVLLDEAFGDMENPGEELTEAGLAFMSQAPADDPILDDYDPRIEKLTKEWEEEIIQKQFQEDPVDDQGKPVIEASQAYARGWFAALAKNESDLRGAGYAAWRWWKSKAGARAYDRVMAEETAKGTEWKEANRLAMRSFWNAGRIVYLRPESVDIQSEANGKVQTVNWGLASWKLKHAEIHLSSEDRQRLKTILRQKGWGYPVLRLLNA